LVSQTVTVLPDVSVDVVQSWAVVALAAGMDTKPRPITPSTMLRSIMMRGYFM
jgi:hypothetical protein